MAILDLIWGIINGAAILYFFYLLIGLIFRGRKTFQNQPELISFPILIIGILGIFSSKPNKEIPVKIIEPGYVLESIAIPYSGINKLHLDIYRNKITSKINPVFSESSLSGFVSGRNWEHLSVEYKEGIWKVTGKVSYSFMGAKIFSTEEILNHKTS